MSKLCVSVCECIGLLGSSTHNGLPVDVCDPSSSCNACCPFHCYHGKGE